MVHHTKQLSETANNSRYIVYYPRAGLGNRLLSFASAYYLSLITGRQLVLAPPKRRETFDCKQYSEQMCSYEMNSHVRALFRKNTDKSIYFPEAFGLTCGLKNQQSLKHMKCKNLSELKDMFIQVSSCQYYLPILRQNTNYKHPNIHFSNIVSKILSYSSYSICENGIHIRKPISSQSLKKFVKCTKTYNVSHVFVATMHQASFALVEKQINASLLSRTKANHVDIAEDKESPFYDLKFMRSCRRVFASDDVSTYTQIIAASYTHAINWNTCQRISSEPLSHIISNDICNIQNTKC